MGNVTFTNKHNIPQFIVDAIIQDDHFTNGDISVTQLIDSPQIRILKKMHSYDMDVSDLIAAFMGTGLHSVIERADMASKNIRHLKNAAMVLREQIEPKDEKDKETIGKVIMWLNGIIKNRLQHEDDESILKEFNTTMDVECEDGTIMRISGTFDRFELKNKRLRDIKQCKVNAYLMPEFKKSWEAQLNIYASMIRAEGYEVEEAFVDAFFKDWSEMSIVRNAAYPKAPYQEVPIRMIDNDKMMKYIQNRVELHHQAETTLKAVCTPKDMWSKSDTYKVMKKGGKKSYKNCPSEQLANSVIDELEIRNPKDIGKFYVEFYPGENTRCEKYCPVAQFCPQHKAELMARNEKSQNSI